MALPDDAPDFHVDQLRGLFAVRLAAHEASTLTGPVVLARRELDHAELVAHSPAGHHLACQSGGLLDVALRTGGPRAVDDLLGGAAAQRAHDLRAQIGFGIVVAVCQRPLIGHAERLPARNNGDTVDRIGARLDQPQDGVSALVVGHTLLVRFAQDDETLGPEYDLFQRVDEILVVDLVLPAPGSQQRRLVDEVADVGAGDAGRRLGYVSKIDVSGKRHLARVNLEDGLAAALVRQVDDNAAVEPACAQQRLVQNVRLVGRGKYYHAFTA